jgi:hypothetical protein
MYSTGAESTYWPGSKEGRRVSNENILVALEIDLPKHKEERVLFDLVDIGSIFTQVKLVSPPSRNLHNKRAYATVHKIHKPAHETHVMVGSKASTRAERSREASSQ